MKRWKRKAASALLLFSIVVLAACGNQSGAKNGQANGAGGSVEIDGSSTVYPIMQAVSEEFLQEHPNVKVPVGVSGTGGGFAKFLRGETDLNNASRPISEKEKQLAEKNGIEYVELELAYDGLSVVVNPANDWVDSLTVEQLKKMWKKDSPIRTWSDLNPQWPDEEIKFFSPGTASGTFDYWSEVILDEAPMRRDARLAEDDNVLVQGVTGSKYGIAYFGYAYYEENKDRLKVVAIDNGKGKPVKPTFETIQSKTYAPLSRPLFTYVNVESLKNDEAVYNYVLFTLKHAAELVKQVGYVPLPEEKYQKQIEKIKEIAGKSQS